MCFFFVLGIMPREKRVGSETRFCAYCNQTTLHTLYERRMWFFLFFIPILPVSGKQIIARCDSCGMENHGEDYGIRTEIRTCPGCASEVLPDARYCHYCGRRL